MAHEPEDENPIDHEEGQDYKAAACQAFRVLGLVIVKRQHMGDQSWESMILIEFIVYVPVVISNPIATLIQIILVGLFRGKCNAKRVVESSHSILFEAAQNGRSILRVPVFD